MYNNNNNNNSNNNGQFGAPTDGDRNMIPPEQQMFFNFWRQSTVPTLPENEAAHRFLQFLQQQAQNTTPQAPQVVYQQVQSPPGPSQEERQEVEDNENAMGLSVSEIRRSNNNNNNNNGLDQQRDLNRPNFERDGLIAGAERVGPSMDEIENERQRTSAQHQHQPQRQAGFVYGVGPMGVPGGLNLDDDDDDDNEDQEMGDNHHGGPGVMLDDGGAIEGIDEKGTEMGADMGGVMGFQPYQQNRGEQQHHHYQPQHRAGDYDRDQLMMRERGGPRGAARYHEFQQQRQEANERNSDLLHMNKKFKEAHEFGEDVQMINREVDDGTIAGQENPNIDGDSRSATTTTTTTATDTKKNADQDGILVQQLDTFIVNNNQQPDHINRDLLKESLNENNLRSSNNSLDTKNQIDQEQQPNQEQQQVDDQENKEINQQQVEDNNNNNNNNNNNTTTTTTTTTTGNEVNIEEGEIKIENQQAETDRDQSIYQLFIEALFTNSEKPSNILDSFGRVYKTIQASELDRLAFESIIENINFSSPMAEPLGLIFIKIDNDFKGQLSQKYKELIPKFVNLLLKKKSSSYLGMYYTFFINIWGFTALELKLYIGVLFLDFFNVNNQIDKRFRKFFDDSFGEYDNGLNNEYSKLNRIIKIAAEQLNWKRLLFIVLSDRYSLGAPVVRNKAHLRGLELIVKLVTELDYPVDCFTDLLKEITLNFNQVRTLEIALIRARIATKALLVCPLHDQAKHLCYAQLRNLLLIDLRVFESEVMTQAFDANIQMDFKLFLNYTLFQQDQYGLYFTLITSSEALFLFFKSLIQFIFSPENEVYPSTKAFIELFRSNSPHIKTVQAKLLRYIPLNISASMYLYLPKADIPIIDKSFNSLARINDIAQGEAEFLANSQKLVLSEANFQSYYTFCRHVVRLFINTDSKLNQSLLLEQFQRFLNNFNDNITLGLPYIIFFKDMLLCRQQFILSANRGYNEAVIKLGLLYHLLNRDGQYPHWKAQVQEYMVQLDQFVVELNARCILIKSNYDPVKKDEYVSVSKILISFNKFEHEPIEDLEKKYFQELAELTNLIKISEWLNDKFGFSIDDSHPNQLQLIEKIQVQRNRILTAKGPNGQQLRSQVNLNFLIYFHIYQKSTFFESIFKFFSRSIINNLDSVCEATQNFMKKLVDRDTSMILNEIFQNIASEVQEQSYQKELYSIFTYFYPNKSFDNITVSTIKTFIDKATFLFGVKSNISQLYDFFSRASNYIQISDFSQTKKSIESIVNSATKKSIAEASKDITDLTEILGNLTHHHLLFFNFVTFDLMEFFSSFKDMKSFDSQGHIITSNLIGDQKNSSLLDNTIFTKNLLVDLIQIKMDVEHQKQSPRVFTFREFCGKMATHLNQQNVTQAYFMLQFVIDNMSQIQSLYKTGGGAYNSQSSLQQASLILKKSTFISNSTKCESGSDGWIIEIAESKIHLNQDKVEDQVRGLNIFSSRSENAHDPQQAAAQEQIKHFDLLFKLLTRIHSLHLELDRVYHPKFVNGTIKAEISPQTMGDLHSKEFEYKEEIESWKQTINSLPKFLLLLRASGISSLISSLKEFFSKPVTDSNLPKLVKILFPYLKVCLPSIESKLISQVITGYKDTFFGGGEVDETSFLNQLFTSMEEMGLVDMSDDDPMRTENEPIFMYLQLENKSNLLNVLMQLNDGVLPKPYQLFYSHTFHIDIDYFMMIAEKFSDQTFFLVGIPKDKEKLLSWVSDKYNTGAIKRLAKVFFVSIDKSSSNSEIFSFLPVYQQQFNPEWKNFKDQWSHEKVKQGIKSLGLVKGASGSGKTHYIKSQAKDKTSIIVLVRLEFDLNSLIEKISKLIEKDEKDKEVFIHFVISPLCDFEVLNYFFYPLIAFGFIYGAKGQILNISETMQLTTFVEIGAPLEESDLPYNKYVEQSIPLIYHLADSHDHTKAPWEISNVEKKCFSYIDCNFYNTPTLDQGSHITITKYWDYVKKIFTEKLKNFTNQSIDFLSNSNNCIARKNFFTLLYERLVFLDDYHEFCIVVKFYDRHNNTRTVDKLLTLEELYYILLLESVQLADPVLSSASEIWKNPPLVTARSILADKDNKKAILDFIDFSKNEGKIIPATKRDSLYNLEKALTRPQEFRLVIANSFGITTRTYIVGDLANQYGYVLTPELSQRLIILNNKIKNQRSLILTGDTGVGKTFILVFYSLLINAQNNAIPDIIYDIKEKVQNIISKYNYQLKPITVHGKEYTRLPGDCTAEIINEALIQLYNFEPPFTETIKPNQQQPQQQQQQANNNNGVVQKTPEHLEFLQKYKFTLLAEMEDCMKKILLHNKLIYVPPSSSLSSILTAKEQKSIQSLEALNNLISEICSVKFKSLFHRIIMHKKLNSKEFKLFVQKVVQESKELVSIDKGLKMVVFIDEFNTSPDDTLSLINEIFMDGTIDGEGPLPSNIFWIGAMNPLQVSKDTINYTGEQATMTNDLSFVVRQTPPSMKLLYFDYGEFNKESEISFLKTLFDNRDIVGALGTPNDNAIGKEHLLNMILIGQNGLREAHQSRTHVSIRDLTRAIDLYKFFKSNVGYLIFEAAFPSIDKYETITLHWLAIICTCAMTYVYRLTEGPKNTCKRSALINQFDQYMKKVGANKAIYGRTFMECFKLIYSTIIEKTKVPEGIAKTDSLQLNIFFTIVSINCNIPLCIIGPPGCSKTLSFSIVLENLNANKTDKTNFYSHMPNTIPYRYQCTSHTTDIEIQSIMNRAIERQKVLGSTKENKIRCAIHLDEAGLVDEKDSPMKIMHDYLDKLSQKIGESQSHEDISIIILSNKILDAAKTNRMLVLVHPPSISDDDEISLVVGCLFGYKNQLTAQEQKICLALSKSYKRVNEFSKSTKENLFHQRDFVFFLRHLQRFYQKEGQLRPEHLLNSLERHFNGIPLEDFNGLVSIFFDHMGFNVPVRSDNTILRIKESLNETLTHEQNPNTCAFRYMMLIDPSENETSLMILKELGIQHKVIRVGGFDKDSTTESLVSVVSQIKNEMSTGGTVVLVNTQLIDACFYDVFNRYFQLVNDRSGDVHFIANVSFGTHSVFCNVHPNFKIIVHLPMSRMKTTHLPWLNRFEKYVLSVDHLLNYYLNNNIKKSKQAFYESLQASGKHFVQEFHEKITNKSLLFGYSEETVSSLIYSIAKKSAESTTSLNPYQITSGIDTTEPEEKNDYRLFNWKILQIARPESIFKCKSLPKAYMSYYLLKQEHFNCIRFLNDIFKVFSQSEKTDQGLINKWILYTRTSLTFHRLKEDENVDAFYQAIKFNNEKLDKTSLKLIQLHSIESSIKCKIEIDSFKQSKTQQICLIFADMTISNQNQISYVLELFDNHPGKLLIIVCHFPPEYSIYNQSKINSIFLDNTEFLYIDSLGLNTDSTLTEGSSSNLIDSDIRSWIAQAFGLKVHIPQESIYQTFNKMFFEHLHNICADMNMYLAPRIPGAIQISNQDRQFYQNKDIREDLMKKLFEKNEVWYYQVVDQFVRNWNSKNILSSIVENISSLIKSGKLVRSFIDSIKDSLTSYFYPVISQVFKLLVNYQSFGEVNQIEPGSFAQLLITLYIKSTKLPKISMKIDQRFEPISLLPPLDIKTKPSFILYDSISTTLGNYFSHVVNSVKNRNPLHVFKMFRSYIDSNPIKEMVDFIDSKPEVQEQFATDFLIRTVKVEPELARFFSLILKKLSPVKDKTILVFYVSSYYSGNTIYFIRSIIYPILNLANIDKFLILKKFGAIIEENIQENLEISKFKQSLITFSYQTLDTQISDIFFKYKEANSKELKDALVDDLLNWTTSLREMINRSPVDLIIKESDSQDLKNTLAKLIALYQIFLNASIQFEKNDFHFILEALIKCNSINALSNFNLIPSLKHLQMVNQTLIQMKKGPLCINLETMLEIVEHMTYSSNENIKDFLLLCNDSFKDLPEIPLGWFSYIITSHLNSNNVIKEVVRNLSNEIFQRAKITEFYSPTELKPSEIVQEFIGVKIDPPYSKLANTHYYVQIEYFKNMKFGLNEVISHRQIELRSYKNAPNLFSRIILVALETYLIQQFCENLSTDVNKTLDMYRVNKTYISALKEVLSTNSVAGNKQLEYQIKKNQVLFLNKISSDKALFDLLKDKVFLDDFGLTNLFVDSNVTVADSCLMPYMFQHDNPHGIFYRKMREHITRSKNPDFKDLVAESAHSPENKGLFRMSLLLLLYQDYITNQPLEAYSNILANIQLCDLFEISPYMKFYKKILNNEFIEGVQFDNILKRSENKLSESKIIAQLVINFTAASIGSNNKCYLYNLTRNPLSVAGQHFIACDVGNRFRDCGMIYYDANNGDMTSTMGSNVLKKYIVNSTSWSIFAYTVSVTKDIDSSLFSSHLHFCTQLKDKRYNKLIDYIYERGITAINEVRINQENINLHIEPGHFLSEYVYAVWKDSYQGNHAAMRSTFDNLQEVVAYERQYLVPLISGLQTNYPKLKAKLNEIIEQQSSYLSKILKIREDSTRSYQSSIYSYELINDLLSKEDVEGSFKILNFFSHKIEKICISKYFPHLLEFLKVFYKHFSDRLPIENIDFNFKQAVQYLINNDYETKESCATLQRAWDKLLDSWDKISKHLQTMEGGCRARAENEKVVYPINEETALSYLLPNTADMGGNGLIINLIDSWLEKTQNECMMYLESIDLPFIFKNIVEGFQSKLRSHDISDVPIEYGDNYMLLGSDFTPEFYQKYIYKNISYYQSFDRAEFQPNWKYIQTKVIASFLAGKSTGSQLQSYKGTFPFKKTYNINNTILSGKTQKNKEDPTTSKLVPQSIKEINTLLEGINKSEYSEKIKETSIFNFLIHCKNHQHLDDLCRYLSKTVLKIQRADKINPNQSIVEFTGASSLSLEIIGAMKHFTLSSVCSLIECVIEEYLGCGYLYSSMFPEFSYQVTNNKYSMFFAELKQKLIKEALNDIDHIKDYIEYLKVILNKLFSPESMELVKSNQNSLLVDRLPQIIGQVKSPYTYTTFNQFYDQTMVINAYPILLRTIHESLSNLTLKYSEIETITEYVEPFSSAYEGGAIDDSATKKDDDEIMNDVNQTPGADIPMGQLSIDGVDPKSANQAPININDVENSKENAEPNDEPEGFDFGRDADDPTLDVVDDDDEEITQNAPTSNTFGISLRPIKPLETGSEFIHCLFNWIRYIPEFNNLISKKSSQFNTIQTLFSRFRSKVQNSANSSPIDIEKLNAELMSSSEVVGSHPGDILISYLKVFSKIDPNIFSFTNWSIRTVCHTCKTKNDETGIPLPLLGYDTSNSQKSSSSTKSLQDIITRNLNTAISNDLPKRCQHQLSYEAIESPQYLIVPIYRVRDNSINYNPIELNDTVHLPSVLKSENNTYSIHSVLCHGGLNGQEYSMQTKKEGQNVLCSATNTIVTDFDKTVLESNCCLVILRKEATLDILNDSWGISNNQASTPVAYSPPVIPVVQPSYSTPPVAMTIDSPPPMINNNNNNNIPVSNLNNKGTNYFSYTKNELQDLYDGGVEKWVDTLGLDEADKQAFNHLLDENGVNDYFVLLNCGEDDWNFISPNIRSTILNYVQTLKLALIQHNLYEN